MNCASQWLEPLHRRIGRWLGAAVVVCAAHVGGAALALMHWQQEPEAYDAAAAMVLELAPLPAVIPVDSPDVAHGPLAEEAASTQQPKQQPADEAHETALADPSPALEPEVTVPLPRPVEKEQPQQEPAREAGPEQQTPEQASPAPLTTAPPRVEAEPAPKGAQPSPGRSASLARVQATWQKALIDHLNRYKRYPDAARQQRAQGTAVVAFKLDRSGRVVAAHVTRSSGSPTLDGEALAVHKRASPLPAPPAHVSGATLDLILPIQFRIR
jgi:protein TonB